MRKAKTFILNAVILTVTALFLRTIGVSFQVYISNKVGAEGMGLFGLIMSVYMLAITLASSGIHLAATRLVTEELAHGSEAGAKKAMLRCMLYSLAFGLLACVLMLLFAPYIGTKWLGDVRTVKSLYMLSVSLPFIALSSAMSGYFTAVRRVIKSASSQIFEQFVRIAIAVYALSLFAPKGLEYACLSLMIGGSIAELASFLYLYLLYKIDQRRYHNNKSSGKHLTRRMLKIALPIAFSSYIRTGLNTISHLMIPVGLRKSGASGATALAEYGVISGMVLPVILFPSAFLTAFSSLLVPEITEYRERKNHAKIESIITRVFQITLLFSIGVSGILMNYSDDLGMLLYGRTDASLFINLLAPLITAMYLDSAVDAMLKGLDQQVSSMRYNVIESVVSIVLIYYLLPRYGIMGYIMEIYICELLNTCLSVNRLILVTKFKIQFQNWILKPAIGIFGAILTTKVVTLYWQLPQTIPGVVLSITLCSLLYFISLRLMSCIKSSDYHSVKAVLK